MHPPGTGYRWSRQQRCHSGETVYHDTARGVESCEQVCNVLTRSQHPKMYTSEYCEGGPWLRQRVLARPWQQGNTANKPKSLLGVSSGMRCCAYHLGVWVSTRGCACAYSEGSQPNGADVRDVPAPNRVSLRQTTAPPPRSLSSCCSSVVATISGIWWPARDLTQWVPKSAGLA